VDSGEAFQIVRIDHVEGGLIAASGRAYRDLHIGDILEGRASRSNEAGQSAEFTIVGITTYGRTIQSLGRMLTGELLLDGRDGRIPRVETLFIKKPRSQDKPTAHLGRRSTGHPR
jgi:hypothetical protein